MKIWSEKMNNEDIKKQADIFMYDYGLLKKLNEFGKPHIIGSYRMDVMAWNDLDIYISNEKMTTEKLYQLTLFIINTFKPIWYEAKQEINAENKKVWFHGFETMILGSLWNFDLWFFDHETIKKAEEYCDTIKNKLEVYPKMKKSIIDIKRELIDRGLYSFDKFTSIDVYQAVIDKGINTIDDFLRAYTS